MATTLQQARNVLSATELTLFEGARRDAIGQFSTKQLEAKVARMRVMRDKARDLYRRQTVKTRTGPASRRAPLGGENQRTEQKAEILADVLRRYEVQLAKAQARDARELAKKPAAKRAAAQAAPRHNAPGAPTTQTNPKAAQRSRRRSGDAAPGLGADLPMRGASSTKKRDIARMERSAQAAGEAAVRQPSTRRAAAKKSVGKTATKNIGKSITALTQAVKKAAAKTTVAEKATVKSPRAVKAKGKGQPVVGSQSARLAQGAVPSKRPAITDRLDPLKAKPQNLKIHASARGRMKAFQGKKDAR